MNATVYDLDSMPLTEGLKPASRSNQAINIARRMAEERGEAVLLQDDDGDWAVFPDGEAVLGRWLSSGPFATFSAPENADNVGILMVEPETEAEADQTASIELFRQAVERAEARAIVAHEDGDDDASDLEIEYQRAAAALRDAEDRLKLSRA